MTSTTDHARDRSSTDASSTDASSTEALAAGAPSSSEGESGAAFFEACKLCYAYSEGEQVVSDVSLRIASGEMVGLIGPNGAGKSTLLALLTGLLGPSAGTAAVRGRDVASIDPRPRARLIGFVPQSPQVFFPYTVAQIVAMGRNPHLAGFAGPGREDHERIDWAMEVTGTRRFRDRLFNQLSAGEAQRVIIARALAQETPALVLDEPTSSLDLFYQTAVYGLLERLNRERAMTILIVTHDINLAAEYCPRLIGLRGGRVLMAGPPEQIVTTERIHELYDVHAEIILGPANGDSGRTHGKRGEARLVRVRHAGEAEDKNKDKNEGAGEGTQDV